MASIQRSRILGIICVFVHSVQSALISAPFDNFRIECPQNAGAQRLSIRMVESQGLKRQDTVFSISCGNINELYPWNGIPSKLAAFEREECHYSTAFDPIMDTASEISCGPREYVASIVRLYGTKIQVGCCKLRTRDETNCLIQRFAKPYGINIRTEIENRAMLINSISMDGNYYQVRFCDLTPRAAGLIEEDFKKSEFKRTSTTASTSTTTAEQTTTQPKIETTQTISETTQTISETTTDATSPKKVIKVKKPISTNQTSEKSTESASQAPISIDLTTILQPPQPNDNIDENAITSIQRSLHGTSIVAGDAGHKAKDAPQGLAKIADNDSTKSGKTLDGEVELSSTTQQTTIDSKESSTTQQTTVEVEEKTTEKTEKSTTVEIEEKTTQQTTEKIEEKTEKSTTEKVEEKTTENLKTTTLEDKIESTTLPEQLTTINAEKTDSLPENFSTTVNTEKTDSLSESSSSTVNAEKTDSLPESSSTTVNIEKTDSLSESSSTTVKIEKTDPSTSTTSEIKTTQPESTVPIETTQPESTVPIETSQDPTTIESKTTLPESSTTLKTTEVSTELPHTITAEIITQESTTSETKPEKIVNEGETHPEFVATDGQNTETMFPKMPMMTDYDDDQSDKLMKSIMQMMDAQKELKKLTKQLKENAKSPEEQKPSETQLFKDEPSQATTKELVSDEKVTTESSTTQESTTESIALIAQKRPMSDGETKMDSNKPEKQIEFVQADQEPLTAESQDERDSQKKLDEFIDRAPFDFSAFPHPPENDDQPKPATELPRVTRIQTKVTSKSRLPVASTTKEPEYLVADRLDEIPEPVNLKPRRNYASRTALRRRPTSHAPVIDEETNNSPFDYGDEAQKSTGRNRKTDSGFTEENINSHDLFDQDSSYEHQNEGRFALPSGGDSRFGQRSPFEIRRAPNPHLNEPYNMFDIAEKYALKTERPQSVDILFESPIEETPTTVRTTPMTRQKDGEQLFVPVDNKPMKVPEPVVIEPMNEDRPKKLSFLHSKKQKDSIKQPLPESMDQHLVPMNETPVNASPSTVALPPLVPATRTRPTTISTTSEMTSEVTVPTEATTLSTETIPTEEILTETIPTEEILTVIIPIEETHEATLPSEATPEADTFSTEEILTIIIPVETTTIKTEDPRPLTESISVEQEYNSQTEAYNPLNFYHTQPPQRKPYLREKVLTFCSKDTAIRDHNQMVIACGTESEVWQPNRCPTGSDCFVSNDSVYRICCFIGSK